MLQARAFLQNATFTSLNESSISGEETLLDWFDVTQEMFGVDSNISGGMNYTDLLLSLQAARARAAKDPFKIIINFLNLYFTPIIIIVGLIGNTLSLLVFSVTHLQRLSSSFYLCALALADLGFLIGLSVVWLNHISIDLYVRRGWCQSVQYLTYVCGFLAMWNVVSFTAERYIIVYHPLQKDKYCTEKKARIVVFSFVVFSLVMYSCTLWIYDVVVFFNAEKVCSPLPKYQNVTTILYSIDTVFGCVVPSFLIVVLNVRIMIKIHEFQSRQTPETFISRNLQNHQQHTLLNTSISTMGSMRIQFSSSRPAAGRTRTAMAITQSATKKITRGRSQFRTARMLLILSSIFVLINLPSHAFRVHAFVSRFSTGNSKAPADKFKWHEFFQIIYFLNFAINFFIYSACGRPFRSGLRRMCKKWKYKVQKCWKHRKYAAEQAVPVDCKDQARLPGIRLMKEPSEMQRVN